MSRRLWAGVGAGTATILVLTGAAVLWWQQARQAQEHEAASVRSNGGSIALDTSGTQGVQGMALGGDDSSSGNGQAKRVVDLDSSGSGGGGGNGGSGQYSAPSRDELAKYEAYKDSQEIRYGDIAVGTGPEVKAGSKVTINYRGWLTSGKMFDDSYAKGQSFAFTVGEHRVIPGFESGLLGMKQGGRRRMVIPPAGGYGSQAAGDVPASSVLIFDAELVKVQ